ncbi:hypothetical protein B0T25DRAFT_326704 [Lasiosphaeria hispida]|uniref:Uncharacterized protein n=1 Tax=Lasiosphaeria hispida TaxID=260671 RepID=A0AAJ0M9Z2_9PEZI|nr:hypothetical protein B0T25DRAFT_326704 [Lasiosphaeria hispida]
MQNSRMPLDASRVSPGCLQDASDGLHDRIWYPPLPVPLLVERCNEKSRLAQRLATRLALDGVGKSKNVAQEAQTVRRQANRGPMEHKVGAKGGRSRTRQHIRAHPERREMERGGEALRPSQPQRPSTNSSIPFGTTRSARATYFNLSLFCSFTCPSGPRRSSQCRAVNGCAIKMACWLGGAPERRELMDLLVIPFRHRAWRGAWKMGAEALECLEALEYSLARGSFGWKEE